MDNRYQLSRQHSNDGDFLLNIGNPATNFIDAHFDGNKLVAAKHENNLDIKLNKSQLTMLKEAHEGEYDVFIGVRPECIFLKEEGADIKSKHLVELDYDFGELFGQEIVLYTTLLGQKLLIKVDSKTKINAKINYKLIST